ncbi:MAG: RNA pyrophosphohydrolase [Geminicoccaceae bacterium]
MSCIETQAPLPGYRPCVGIFLLGPARQVFVGQRLDTPEAWQMPQGGIDAGESIAAAGLRELKEEIGTDRVELLRESAIWRAYDLPPAIAARKWHGRYRGQTQRWLAMRFTGEDADIRLDAHEPEFGVWRWVPADRLVELIVPFKRAIYASVVEEFRPLWQPEAGLKQAEGR